MTRDDKVECPEEPEDLAAALATVRALPRPDFNMQRSSPIGRRPP